MRPTAPHGVDLVGRSVLDSAGRRIGAVQDILVDVQSNAAEWLVVGEQPTHIGHAVPMACVIVQRRGGGVVVPFDRGTVESSPDVELDEGVTVDEEMALLRFWDFARGRR
ncbi:PRC-barrel domain-containing protein [Luteipulveratus sp. YIM 133132]|uniref:PRC-barrel domain-containing protein n=1 Tax=Luteipulveratus flavus TaxID=3031728 RepID=A0ABT6CC23_9MICO|nr:MULTISPECIES: PRC-barrel domain-containing protein [unclassified Luteipulveratus]MDE9365646.1 PRC-barrel domain-containing protein [Luteipulveratus sp. YIM 133132]MDF8266316.1 PRC-barrel domain-containing protein [Luteipulveratus sp. YIM 133296]